MIKDPTLNLDKIDNSSIDEIVLWLTELDWSKEDIFNKLETVFKAFADNPEAFCEYLRMVYRSRLESRKKQVNSILLVLSFHYSDSVQRIIDYMGRFSYPIDKQISKQLKLLEYLRKES